MQPELRSHEKSPHEDQAELEELEELLYNNCISEDRSLSLHEACSVPFRDLHDWHEAASGTNRDEAKRSNSINE